MEGVTLTPSQTQTSSEQLARMTRNSTPALTSGYLPGLPSVSHLACQVRGRIGRGQRIAQDHRCLRRTEACVGVRVQRAVDDVGQRLDQQARPRGVRRYVVRPVVMQGRDLWCHR